MYLLPISGADLVLGATWLATLSPHVLDYRKLTLKFYKDNQFVPLDSEQPQLPSPAQFHHLRRMHNTHAIAEVFTLQYKQEDVPQDKWLDLPENMEPELVMLLHNYRSIFNVPTELPPSRTHNHAIPLIKDAKPVKVRPYRYPHSKK